MLSENKLERKNIYKNYDHETFYKDNQNVTKDDTLYNIITYGLIGLTGYGLYKQGFLKDIVKPFLEIADNIAKNGTDTASETMRTINQWSKIKRMSPSQLKTSKQKYNAPKKSLFRDRESSIFYDVFQDTKELSFNKITNFKRVKEVIEDTSIDIKILNQMINDNIKLMKNKRDYFFNTDLYRHMEDVKSFNELVETVSKDQRTAFGDESMKAFLTKMTLTPEQASQQLKESGYRNVVLGDILEFSKDENGNHRFKPKVIEHIDLSKIDPSSKNNTSFMEQIEYFIRNPSYGHGSNNSMLKTGEWKNIILDKSIKINEKGHIIDYRMTKDNAIDFIQSLSRDFRLPVVHFNPIKPFENFITDKIGRNEPLTGLIASTRIDPGITGKGGRYTIGEWLGDTFGEEFRGRNVAVINGVAYTTDSNNQLFKIKENLRLHDITYANRPYGIKSTLNATRQMAGLDLGEPIKQSLEKYEKSIGRKLTKYEKIKYETAKFLDLGFQEVRPSNDNIDNGLDTTSSIDEIINKFIDKQTKKIRVNGFEYNSIDEFYEVIKENGFNYKTVFGEGFDQFINDNGYNIKNKEVATTIKGYTLSSAIKHFNNNELNKAGEELKGFFAQFGSGRNKHTNEFGKYFTERTSLSWGMLNALNEGLGFSSYLLGLSTSSKSSVFDIAKNLLLKRALPVYMLTKVPDMVNYFTEPFFDDEDELGNKDNITKFMMRNVVKPIDITSHGLMDLFGATKLFKFMQEMTPGTEQITELPLISFLGLGQTKEEREDYIENGVDPVRKGRWWSSGNTPLTGGKIMYYRPNLYRRIEADVKFSDSKWGSRQEYYNNTWFPNPINPFAPINHFILNRNYYDKKHYYDRPYLKTASVGSNIPIIGPVFSATAGTIINPQHKMHLEYWRDLNISTDDEKAHSLITNGTLKEPNDNDIQLLNLINDRQQEQSVIYNNSLYTSRFQAKEITKKSIKDNAGINFIQYIINPKGSVRVQQDNQVGYESGLEVYSTPSGALSIVDVPDDMNLYNVNQDLREYSLSKVTGTNQRISQNDFNYTQVPVGNDKQEIDNAFMYNIGEQYNWLSDIYGLKGFALQTFVTGEANQNSNIVENSNYAYSANKEFWDMNLGGLGGNLSEITRRFIPKRNNSTNYINPIRNTMPSWMPGSNYFTDFKHGDPYSKIENGEERLPGEGYERLYNIKGIMDLRIGSSSIGYEKDYIIQHLLDADDYISVFEKETLEKGDKVHAIIEKQWEESGLAIQTEGKVEDEQNGIIGWYDAMVYDMSSPTGVSIVDIKSTSAKKLDEIRKTKKPLTHHMRQTNYYLWATGNYNSKGYIHYVDKEDPTNTYTVGFEYSQKELEKTLQNVYDARKDILTAIKNGELGRGELYDPIDQLRILADVAPYSQEYKNVVAKLASEDLTPEEQKEVSQIKERMVQQKEPLRVYPYKFKTSNLKTETVTVSKIIDNNTFLTEEYGTEHAIKFAGINISESNSEMYNKFKTKNKAARQEINRYLKPGRKIQISYDADVANKFSSDSTSSIKAVISLKGKNINRIMVNKGHAKLKKEDDSPAAMNVRYSKGELAFGSAMEFFTHDIIGNIPFVGSKFYQVRSPYEQYRKREVYGKDFQSWNHPIRDILIPYVQEGAANNTMFGLGGIITGAFIGSLFGKNKFGKIVGATIGGAIPTVGKVVYAVNTTKDREWIPQRRKEQEAVNEYVDTLKYVKNMKLYYQYVNKAKLENNFDVVSFIQSKEYEGTKNKLKEQELINYKKRVKLDFKHRNRYNFKYGKPKYETSDMTQKETVSAINKELSEIQSNRKVVKLPDNAMKAIYYKQLAEKTMYGYNPGDSLTNIMSALPKKERQYFKHFMDAPEEEKEKILRIAPSYLRRALQSTWGMKVDKKPTLQEYFQSHALPDASWIGWDENVDMDSVKVKIVHQNKLDFGEFDIWDDAKIKADSVNIPIPKMYKHTNPRDTQLRLTQILGQSGFENINMSILNSYDSSNNTTLTVNRDVKNDVSNQISNIENI